MRNTEYRIQNKEVTKLVITTKVGDTHDNTIDCRKRLANIHTIEQTNEKVKIQANHQKGKIRRSNSIRVHFRLVNTNEKIQSQVTFGEGINLGNIL